MSRLSDGFLDRQRETWKPLEILSHSRMGLFGLFTTLTIIVTSLVGSLVWSPDGSENMAAINQGISAAHWLGTDFWGQDNLRKVVNGGRDVVIIAIAAGILSTSIALLVGALTAFVGGRLDGVLMVLVGAWLKIPKFPLLAFLTAVLNLKNILMLAVLLALLDGPAMARQVRSQVLLLKRRDYVEAACMLDLGMPHIILRELLPNMMPFLANLTVAEAAHAVYQQTGLLFLGLMPYSSANWGVMISLAEGKGALGSPEAASSILIPVAAIVLFQLALVLLARSLRRVVDPHVRANG